MRQRVVSFEWDEQGDRAHPAVQRRNWVGSWGSRDTSSSLLGVTVAFLLLTLFAVPARAQGVSSLQASARVIQITPSREALAEALQPVQAIPQPLAQIDRLRLSGIANSPGHAFPPRTIITIAFLRN